MDTSLITHSPQRYLYCKLCILYLSYACVIRGGTVNENVKYIISYIYILNIYLRQWKNYICTCQYSVVTIITAVTIIVIIVTIYSYSYYYYHHIIIIITLLLLLLLFTNIIVRNIFYHEDTILHCPPKKCNVFVSRVYVDKQQFC